MKKKNLGLLFLLAPIFILILVLALYAIVTFVVMTSMGSLFTSRLSIINFVLGALGIIALLSFVPGIFFGLKFLSQKDQIEIEKLKKYPEYQHLTEEQIFFITKVSWGCFFQTFVWCMGNKLYWRGVVSLVPFVGVYPWIELTINGRRAAWEKGGWRDFDQFKKRQKTMAYIILAVISLTLILRAYGIYTEIIGKFNAFQDNKKDNSEQLSPSEVSTEYYCRLIKDTDSDGLFDTNEDSYYATDPNKVDTDDDGFTDLEEVRSNNNPNGTGKAERNYTNREESSLFVKAKEKCSTVQ